MVGPIMNVRIQSTVIVLMFDFCARIYYHYSINHIHSVHHYSINTSL